MTSLGARLARARARLFGTAARDVPVPFEVTCDCGSRVAGIRRLSFQLATCSACASQVYVLPVNVYPATRRIQSEVVDGPVTKRVGTVVRDLVVGDRSESSEGDKYDAEQTKSRRTVNARNEATNGAEYSAGGRTGGKSRKRSDSTINFPTAEASKQAVQNAESAVPLLQVPRRSVGARLKRVFSPARLLALTGVCVLVATLWWNVHQRKMTQARKAWRFEMDAATEAMKKEDLVLVRESLAKAVTAATTLQRHDAEANEARALLWQAETVDRLSVGDFVKDLTGLVDPGGRLNAVKAADVGRSLIGQRLLFETPLRPASSSGSLPVLDLPLVIDEIPVIIEAPSKLLLDCSASNPSIGLLFIGTVAQCKSPTEEARQWVITLEGESCTLITHAFFARQVGYDPRNDSSVVTVLEHQAEFIKSAGVLANENLNSSTGSK